MVLRCGADHRRPADVDILDAVVEAGALRHRLLERIEAHHQEIDRPNIMRLHRGGVFLVVAHAEQSAMHFWMQGLHPAVHHLGKSGQLGHVDDLQPRVLQRLGGAAG